MQKLSVVIPAYNEEKTIKNSSLDDVWSYLSKQKYNWEVVVVDDASTDKTLALSTEFAKNHKGIRVLAESHRGKGGSVIAGMLKASGDIILFADMDQATPINQIEKLLPEFNEGFDIAIGSRSGRKGAPIIRKAMAYGFSVIRTLVLRLPFKDTQCGFKAFKKDAAKNIFNKMMVVKEKTLKGGASVSAGFDLEVLYIARKLGYKVAEVPVEWHHKETERINPIKDSYEGLRDLLKVRINALQGKYKV
ncbi:MAG: dolichyl-phosphate beta-glucosyltransferase [Patescibacteria group bacterium]